MLFGLGWFVGVLGSVAVAFDAAPLRGAAEAVRLLLPTDGLWRGVIYGLEPPLVLLADRPARRPRPRANPFFADAPPPAAFIAWAVVWVVLVLLAGDRPVPAPGALAARRD